MVAHLAERGVVTVRDGLQEYADRLMFCSIHLMYSEGKFKVRGWEPFGAHAHVMHACFGL